MDESLPEVIEFLLLYKKCQTRALVFVYQGCHIQIRMDCAKNYGYESYIFITLPMYMYIRTYINTHTYTV